MLDLLGMIEEDVSQPIVPSNEQMQELSYLIEQFFSYEKKIAEAEKELEHLKDNFKNISENRIPATLQAMGMKSFVTLEGKEVSFEKRWTGSISEENKVAAHKWLEDNGHGSIIKNSVSANIPKGPDSLKMQKEIEDFLNQKKDVVVKSEKAVHYKTLEAFIKEQKAKGVDLPSSISTFEITKTKIKNK